MSTTLSAYTDSVRNKGWPIAGWLISYSVSENLCVDHESLRVAMEAFGLDRYVPKAPHDDDVFRRTCTKAQRKREAVPNQPELFENYLVRDVRQAAGHFWKQIVVETVDGDNRKLDYQPATELHFDPDNPDRIQTKQFVRKFHRVSAVIDDILSGYAHWRGKIASYTFRETIREIVTVGANALVVRSSGGLYFVPDDRMDLINRLDQLITQAPWVTGSAELTIIPLIDDQRQREMVKKAFEEEAVGELTKLTHECAELISSGSVSDRKFTAMNKRLRAAEARVGEYQTVLDDALDTASLRLRSAKAKMTKLYGVVN
jgi:hypothetical protein